MRDAVQDESRIPGKVIQLAFIPRFAGLKNPVYTLIFVTNCNISNNAVSDQWSPVILLNLAWYICSLCSLRAL